MAAILDNAKATFADGPGSAPTEPNKAAIIRLFGLIEAILGSAINGVLVSGAVVYQTRAALFANLARPDGSLGVVYGDSNPSYNGYYAKSGASGTGSWTLTNLALPSTFAADLAAVITAQAATAAEVVTARNGAPNLNARFQVVIDYIVAQDGVLGAQISAAAAQSVARDDMLGGQILDVAGEMEIRDTELGDQISAAAAQSVSRDDTLTAAIAAEASARATAVSGEASARAAAVTAEAATRSAADDELGEAVNAEVAARVDAVAAEASARATAVSGEASARAAAVEAEAAARSAADNELGEAVNDEVAARVDAVAAEASARATAVGAEATAREAADTALDGRVIRVETILVEGQSIPVLFLGDQVGNAIFYWELQPPFRVWSPSLPQMTLTDVSGRVSIMDSAGNSIFALEDQYPFHPISPSLPKFIRDNVICDFVISDEAGNPIVYWEGGTPRGPWFEEIERAIAGSGRQGITIDIDGDSRTDFCTDFAGQRVNTLGWLYWLQLFTDARFNFGYNFGVGGQRTDEVLARVAATVAGSGDVIIALFSTNDRTAGYTYQQTIDNLAAYQAAILAAGKELWWVAELPRGDSSGSDLTLSAAQLRIQNRVRRWIINQASVKGVRVADAWPAVVDPSSSQGLARDGMLKDRIHEAPAASIAIAKALAPLVTTRMPPVPRLPASNSDLYHSTENPSGSLVSNPMTLGTSGTRGGAGTSSGNVATGYAATTPAGITAIYSKVVIDGDEWQQVEISGTAPANRICSTLTIPIDPTYLAAGNVIEIAAEIDVDAGHTGLRALNASLSVTDDGSGGYCAAGQYLGSGTDINLEIPPIAFGGTVIAKMSPLASGAVSACSLSIQAFGGEGNAIDVTYRFRAASARKII